MSLVGARHSETQQPFDQLLPILLELLLDAFLLYKKWFNQGHPSSFVLPTAQLNRYAQLKENWHFSVLQLNKYEIFETNS